MKPKRIIRLKTLQQGLLFYHLRQRRPDGAMTQPVAQIVVSDTADGEDPDMGIFGLVELPEDVMIAFCKDYLMTHGFVAFKAEDERFNPVLIVRAFLAEQKEKAAEFAVDAHDLYDDPSGGAAAFNSELQDAKVSVLEKLASLLHARGWMI